MRILCLSNGHGEDIIALRIIQALQRLPGAPEIDVLPIVGEGNLYQAAGLNLIGTVKAMPSGGFIYMDGKQLARDIQGGLVKLTLAQIGAVKAWGKQPDALGVVAVGDIVPMLFAWRSGKPFAFVGTAKSEYYLRDEADWLARKSWWDDRLAVLTGSVYFPWERWLMQRRNCRGIFPRDRITAENLQRLGLPAFDLGNPMMDGLEWEGDDRHDELTIALIPGSRVPEAYENWTLMLKAIDRLGDQLQQPVTFLAALAPGLEADRLLEGLGFWRKGADGNFSSGLSGRKMTLRLMPGRFAEVLARSDVALAMAGTATEQFVGLGKPVVTMSGAGPQFTPQFAEAQCRLLGESVMWVTGPEAVGPAMKQVLGDSDRLQDIRKNGLRRMGPAGAADRIAAQLMAGLARE
jgi:uncharacterized protein (TIGR03492 family)